MTTQLAALDADVARLLPAPSRATYAALRRELDRLRDAERARRSEDETREVPTP